LTSVITYDILLQKLERAVTTIDRKRFSEAVKRFREANDLTQKELAQKIGTTTTTVARWELGISVPKQDRIIKEIQRLGIKW